MKNDTECVVITAARSTYIVAAVICAPSLLVSLLASSKRLDAGPALIAAAFCLLMFLWVQRFRVRLDGEAIEYRSLLGTKKMALADIGSAKVQVGEYSYRDRYLPPIRLEIKSKDKPRPQTIIINLKVFSLPDVRTLLEYVGLD